MFFSEKHNQQQLLPILQPGTINRLQLLWPEILWQNQLLMACTLDVKVRSDQFSLFQTVLMLQNQPVVWSVDSVEFPTPVSNVPTTLPAFKTKEQTIDGGFHQVMMSWVSLLQQAEVHPSYELG